MFNKILAAVASLAMVASPVNARIEDGTKPLLHLMDTNGIPVTFNGPECASGDYLGVYIHRGLQRKMVLCPGQTVEAIDHAVVRHEAWHAIQHCVNTVRGTSPFTPIAEDTNKLMQQVKALLTEEQIQAIYRVYPKNHWLIEFEAYVAMNVFTADEIAELFVSACVLTD
jgi:hypothetical protein